MRPDDPRHGTYAGYIAHHKSGQDPCEPCSLEGRRARKLLRIRGPQQVPMGGRVWRILHTTHPAQLAVAAGLCPQHVRRLRATGPDHLVYRRTRQALLDSCPVTIVGLQRRVRALAFIGWSCSELAQRSALSVESLKKLRRADVERRHFVKQVVVDEVRRLYRELQLTPAPTSRQSERQRRDAVLKGWVSPMAWDDIDHDDAPRLDADGDDRDLVVDEAAILRRMHGDKTVPLSTAEKDCLVERCLSRGWTYSRIEEHTGVNVGRAVERLREVA